MRNYENVDFSSVYDRSFTVSGSASNNIIIGSSGSNTLSGAGGDDVLRGGGIPESNNVLDGGSGDDLIYGGGGYFSVNYMTGGSGADTFRWTGRASIYDFDGLDRISDFKPGQDHLAFTKENYTFAGRGFDVAIVASGTRTDITGADLILYRGGPIDADGIVDYLNNATGGGDHGVFIAGLNSSGHTVVYYSTSADYGDLGSLTYVADLGDIGQPTNLHLADFAFI